MVDIMHETFKGLLCPALDAEQSEKAVLPSPAKLRNKILIKVKYSPPKKVAQAEVAAATKPSSDTSSLSSFDEDTEPANKEKPKKKVSKIIDALSQLGIYTRSFHFSGLTSPEATIPTHVFSLSESSLTGVQKEDPEGLFNHNKCYLMRAYPKGTRIGSSNLDPSLFWRVGVQMVALNWQRIDHGMMLQEAMFQGTY
jgi:Phosphatidylinositol-specific phospholipase C, Y domain/Phosphatidylinositol-specific phospholipase C, X domain